jgi:hypothetical protein
MNSYRIGSALSCPISRNPRSRKAENAVPGMVRYPKAPTTWKGRKNRYSLCAKIIKNKVMPT